MNLQQYVIVTLGVLVLGLFSALTFSYNENSKLRDEIAQQKANNITLQNALDKQNEAIKQMEIDKSQIEERYQMLHIKYDNFKMEVAQIEEQAEKISKDENISKSESILIAEKMAIQKAINAFYNRKKT